MRLSFFGRSAAVMGRCDQLPSIPCLRSEWAALGSLGKEGAFPLPSISEPSDGGSLRSLHRSVRARVQRRAGVTAEINESVETINALLRGSVHRSEGHSSRSVPSVSQARTVHKQMLLGLREDLEHFRSVAQEHPITEEAAFRELASREKLYGERTDIANYGDAPLSTPPQGTRQISISRLLSAKDSRALAEDAKRLLRPEGPVGDIPRPYWDPALLLSPQVYADFIDLLLDCGLLRLARSSKAQVGIFFVWKADKKKLRVLVDARNANAYFRTPPSTELSSAAALGDT